jgi:RNA polymerase sigma-32 factor
MVADNEERERSVEVVRDALHRLSNRERHIVQERYFGADSTSLASIGRGMGLSRERVRQLEHQAQAKLRDAIAASA